MENIKVLQHNRLRHWVLLSYALSAIILLASAAFGYHFSITLEETAKINAIPFLDIYQNNVSMLGINLLGILMLGIPNLISVVMNGFTLGSAVAISLRQFNGAWFIRSFLPHGIIEFPVILISVSLGLLPWFLIANRIRRPKESMKGMIAVVVRYVLIAGILCTVALLPAAWIEANISMRIIP